MEYFTLHDFRLRSGSYGGNRRSRAMLEIELGRCVVPEIVGFIGQPPDGRPFRLLHTLAYSVRHSALRQSENEATGEVSAIPPP